MNDLQYPNWYRPRARQRPPSGAPDYTAPAGKTTVDYSQNMMWCDHSCITTVSTRRIAPTKLPLHEIIALSTFASNATHSLLFTWHKAFRPLLQSHWRALSFSFLSNRATLPSSLPEYIYVTLLTFHVPDRTDPHWTQLLWYTSTSIVVQRGYALNFLSSDLSGLYRRVLDQPLSIYTGAFWIGYLLAVASTLE